MEIRDLSRRNAAVIAFAGVVLTLLGVVLAAGGGAPPDIAATTDPAADTGDGSQSRRRASREIGTDWMRRWIIPSSASFRVLPRPIIFYAAQAQRVWCHCRNQVQKSRTPSSNGTRGT